MIEGAVFFFEAWSPWGFVEDIGPAVHGAQVVKKIHTQRTGTHFEGLVELIGGEFLASGIEVLVRPAVVGNEDGGWFG